MILRRLTAILLGLVLQLALFDVAPAFPAPEPEPCASVGSCCCGGEGACPCFTSDEEQKPSPLPAIPFSSERLTPFLSPSEPDLSGAKIDFPEKDGTMVFSPSEPIHGYSGVSLAVTFCRFTI